MYEKQERCPYCLEANLRPKGRNKKKNKRRYKCGNCKKHITGGGKKWFVDAGQITLIKDLLLERVALRGICRVAKISLSWLLAYIKKLYAELPDNLNYRMVDQLEIKLELIENELDEMWSFVGKKANKKWIWIAQCRRTRQVVAFHVGDRSRKGAQELWDKLPNLIKAKGLFYSDDWNAYKTVFPVERHIFSKQKKDTNHLERLNNTIRQRVSRLVRKTLSFSKSLENHIGALKYFFCNYNLVQQKRWDKYKSAHS